MSSEDDRICSSSVWEETSFCWKKNSKWNDYHSFKEKHWFFYWTRTRHVSQNLKNTLTMLSSEVDRICSSSVWDETYKSWDNSCFDSICLLSIKSYKYIFPLEEKVSRVTELKNTLTMLSVEVERIRSSSVWDETSFCWNKKTINEMIIILSKTSTFPIGREHVTCQRT